MLWSTVLLCYLAVIYSTTPYLYGVPREPQHSALLFGLNHIVWACMLTLLLWLCITNNGGIVGRILSWNAWKPFARLTYSVYLTHVWILYVVLGGRRQLVDLNLRAILVLCGGNLFLSYLVAAIFTLLFESPLIQAIDSLKPKVPPSVPNNEIDKFDVNQNTKSNKINSYI